MYVFGGLFASEITIQFPFQVTKLETAAYDAYQSSSTDNPITEVSTGDFNVSSNG